MTWIFLDTREISRTVLFKYISKRPGNSTTTKNNSAA